MSDVTTAPALPGIGHTPRLGWPPPGLEAMQGEAWPIIVEFGIGVVLLALPLLFAIATPQPFWSLGAFGQSWWVPLATTLLAFVILLSASWRLSRLLRAAARATRLGYGIGTIAVTATDQERDSGFVLQGARHFANVDPNRRRELLALRITGAASYLAAALWIPVGLALAVMLAQSDVLGIAAMWWITLAPACLLLIAGTVARIAEGAAVRRIKKTADAHVAVDMRREASEWTENLAIAADDAAIGSRIRAKPRGLLFLAFAVVIPALLLIVPVTAVITSAAMGPVVATLSLPRYSRTMERFAVANAMRGYRLPLDSTITPAVAGVAFVNLTHVGRPEVDTFTKPAAVNHPDWPAAPAGWDITTGSRGTVFDDIKRGLEPEQRAYLAEAARHPSNTEFAVLAHAPHADLLGARLALPLPDTLMGYEVPIPKFGKIREAAYIHVAKAASEFADGRNVDAERTLKEIVSAGLLMMDESTSMIEALIGNVIMGIGTQNLERFYRASGRVQDADMMRARMDAAEQAAKFAHIAEPDYKLTGPSLKAMADLVANRDVPRGYRWEYFMAFNNVAPCLNLQNVVLGQGAEYDAWLANVRSTFVRYPSERELFDITSAGLFGTRANPTRGCMPSPKIFTIMRAML